MRILVLKRAWLFAVELMLAITVFFSFEQAYASPKICARMLNAARFYISSTTAKVAEFLPSTPPQDRPPQKRIWASLRGKGLLVRQDSIPGKTGLCGSAAIVNFSQYIRVYLGRKPDPEPQRVFGHLVEKLGSGLDPGETLSALENMIAQDFPGQDIQFTTMIKKGIASKRGRNLTIVDSFQTSDLMPADNEVKFMLIAQLDKNNHESSIHAHLSYYDNNTLHIIDSNDPEIDLKSKHVGMMQLYNGPVPHFKYVDTTVTDEDGTELEGFLPGVVITAVLPPRRLPR